jgi:hypothetical protein
MSTECIDELVCKKEKLKSEGDPSPSYTEHVAMMGYPQTNTHRTIEVQHINAVSTGFSSHLIAVFYAESRGIGADAQSQAFPLGLFYADFIPA